MSIETFLLLSERTLYEGGETEEAFKYEMSRISKACIKLNEALERIVEVAEPFYQKSFDSTRAKLDSNVVSAEMLVRARNSLGIDGLSANDVDPNVFT